MALTGHISADASTLLAGLRALRRSAQSIPPAGPLRDASDETGRLYLAAMSERFDRRGDGDWAPLRDATVKAKARKGYPEPDAPNKGDGRLLRSLTPGDPENVLNPLPDGVAAGTSVPYAVYVQAERPVLVDPDDATEAAMGQALAEGLMSEQEAATR